MPAKDLIVIRGGGDIATGVIQKFFRAGFPVVVLETDAPTAIRRTVSLCQAVQQKVAVVEDMRCRRANSPEAAFACHREGDIPLLVDPAGEAIPALSPRCVVDAILAKRNLGTRRGMAPVTIALGPGFTAGQDVDAVIETMRGHDLGRLILSGTAAPDTGIPGEIAGKSAERVLRAPCPGKARHRRRIGDIVQAGEVLFYVGDTPVEAPFTGLLRGLIDEGIPLHRGMKVADVDPRTDADWRSISDKARCVGGGALEAYLYLKTRRRAGA